MKFYTRVLAVADNERMFACRKSSCMCQSPDSEMRDSRRYDTSESGCYQLGNFSSEDLMSLPRGCVKFAIIVMLYA